MARMYMMVTTMRTIMKRIDIMMHTNAVGNQTPYEKKKVKRCPRTNSPGRFFIKKNGRNEIWQGIGRRPVTGNPQVNAPQRNARQP